MIARKNELKAKSTLLLAIPDEHLLKFHGINKESKKIQKTILKQQYENFTASRSEGLDKIYDRFQKLISQLEIQGEVISQEDANLKLLRSLPSAWNNIALIMRNKPNLDELSMDDLYNNLKVSTNEAVNTALDVSTASTQEQASSSTYADDVMFSFFVNQSKSLQLDNEDMEWNVTTATGKVTLLDTPANALVVQDGIGGYDWSFQAEEGPKDFALMAHLSLGSSSSSSPDSEKELFKKSNLEIIGYQLGLESLEARIVVHEKNEASYEESIAFLKYDVQVKYISIKNLKNQLEEALKEKDDLKLKLEKFEESSKNLTKLINRQISVKDKTRLGSDSHVNESEVLDNVVDSHECYQVNDRFKKSEGYHAVPLPFTRNFKPVRADLSFAGLDDSVYKSKVSETITSVPNVETTITKTSKNSLDKPKTVRFSAPIIDDWESNSEDENVFEPKEVKKTVKSSFEKIEFVES
ncbi:hypothetical protein Tco_1035928 [Tanacetum coccineum]